MAESKHREVLDYLRCVTFPMFDEKARGYERIGTRYSLERLKSMRDQLEKLGWLYHPDDADEERHRDRD